jgi:hypothetical protein
MIKYRYKINNVEIEVLNADSIPDGLKYETIEFEIPKEETFVPQIITRRQFKIALVMLGKNETDILNGINQLPEPTQTIARISYMEAGTFERFNPELIAVATNFLNMTESDIDEIFIIGNQY